MKTDLKNDYTERLKSAVFYPLFHNSKIYNGFVLVLLAIIGWGGYNYITQLRYGLIVTGLNDTTFWGLYIVNFVFFIGISYAGTLVSAVLRVTGAKWRTPITRMAEVIAIIGLMIGGIMPFIDVGRPDRMLNIFIFGRLLSPLVWDIISIITYFIACLIYLYLPLIPDLALMRDNLGKDASPIRRKFYTFLAAGWKNTLEQQQWLEKGMRIMAVLIIPIAIFVHTVVSYIFSITLRPGWNSTIYGPYFVIGAIFSGTAAILIVMVIFRKFFKLEEFITEKQFRYLSYLLVTLLAFYAYFTFTEYLTIGYKSELAEKDLLNQLLQGESAIWFWSFVIGAFIIPLFFIFFRKIRIVPRIVIASVFIFVAMWIKRFVIVLGTLQVPQIPIDFVLYKPTWVEISITLAALAGFVLLFAIFAKLFPIISIWEVSEEQKERSSPGSTPTRDKPQISEKSGREDG
ncbi:NrfD/PsrC family molybdoenzyme membrane anchor subunit [Actinomycetota bacterium]